MLGRTYNEKGEWAFRAGVAGLVLSPIILGAKWGGGGLLASILVAPIAAFLSYGVVDSMLSSDAAGPTTSLEEQLNLSF